MIRLWAVLSFCAWSIPLAKAADILPYTTRTRSYSGWSTAVQGDLRTVGMAGATVGLANTFLAVLDNPAGLAMMVNGADSNFVSNTITDGQVQSLTHPLNAYQFGVAASLYPWGFGFAYRSRTHEGQPYEFQNSPGSSANMMVSTGDIYFSAARVFFDDRLSIGASLIAAQADERIEPQPTTLPYQSYTVSASLGASVQLPSHILLGMSYSLPYSYDFSAPSTATPSLPGFFQSIHTPYRIGVGVGWIPNRFFRGDFSTMIVGPSENAALLRDESIRVGQNLTLQPKLGFAYHFLDLPDVKATVYWGTYYEVSRIQSDPNRLHATTAIEVSPWILALGAGLDISDNYRNFLLSFGLDILKVMQKLEIVPPLWHPPYAGFAPSAFRRSDEGLPRPLVKDGSMQAPPVNAVEIGLAIPKNLEKKAGQLGKKIEDQAKEIGRILSPKHEKKGQNKKKYPKPHPSFKPHIPPENH